MPEVKYPTVAVIQSVGRDGYIATSGVEIVETMKTVLISPLTSTGKTGNCQIVIPRESIWAVIMELYKLDVDQASAEDRAYVATARDQYVTDDIEIDDTAKVSISDSGAWVHAWVYVANDDEPEHDEEGGVYPT